MRSAKTFLTSPVMIALAYSAPTIAVCGETPVARPCHPYEIASRPVESGRAIALVAAYDNPYAASNLDVFSEQLGLCKADLTVVYASGKRPNYDEQSAIENTVDIEMAHLTAPDAKLYVVEAASDNAASIDAAVNKAYQLVVAAGGGQISMTRSVSETAKSLQTNPLKRLSGR